jgi:GcrA cell cycle regulator
MLPGTMIPTEFHQALSGLNLAQQRVAALIDVSPRAVRRWRHGERRVPCGVAIVVHLLAAGAVTIDQVEKAAVRTNARHQLSSAGQLKGGLEPSGKDAGAQVDARTDGRTCRELLEPKTNGNGGLPIEVRDLVHELHPDAVTSAVQGVTEATASSDAVGLPEVTEFPAEPSPEPSAIVVDPATTVGADLTTAEKVAALTATSCRWPCGDPLHSDFRFCGEATTIPPYCETHRGVAYLAPPTRLRLRRRPTSARIAWVG